jgi:Nif-specific regulatory protein
MPENTSDKNHKTRLASFSRLYTFDKLLSKNELAESWLAINIKTNRKCFLKLPAKDCSLNRETIRNVLINSFRLQKPIRTAKIITPTGIHIIKGDPVIEYPLLDSSMWSAMDEKQFWRYYPESLLQISLIVDYLHLLDLVHCDLKLSNFRINASHGQPRIVLVDLDFLTISGSSPNAKILGTPKHIAPEILKNETISLRSDNYSIGILLESCLGYYRKLINILPDNTLRIENLERFAKELTSKNLSQRPGTLIGALNRNDILPDIEYESAKKALFSMQLLTIFLNHRAELRGEGLNRLESHFGNNKISGFPNELLEDFEHSYHADSQNAFKAFKILVNGVKLDRYVDYWQVTCNDSLIFKVYRILSKSDKKLRFFSRDGALSSGQLADVINNAFRYKEKGSFLRAYLSLKLALKEIDKKPVKSDKLQLKNTLLGLAELAKLLNKSEESINYQIRVLELLESGSDDYFNTLKDMVIHFIYKQDMKRAVYFIETGISISNEDRYLSWHLDFMRFKAWVLATKAEYDEAQRILNSVIKLADSHDITDVLIKSYNDLGVHAWRQGRPGEAREFYETAYKVSKEHGLLPEAIPTVSNLSLLYFESANYKKSLQLAKTAANAAKSPLYIPVLPRLFIIISQDYTRLGEYNKARFWLQRYITSASTNRDNAFYIQYYTNEGWQGMLRGELGLAEDYLHKTLEIPSIKGLGKIHGKVYQHLAEIALYRGDVEACERNIEEASRIFNDIQDKASGEEIELIRKLCSLYYVKNIRYQDLIGQLDSLLKNNCLYYAGICLFHFLISADRPLTKGEYERIDHLCKTISKSHAPLFRALILLIEFKPENVQQNDESIRVLKAVYRILESSGHLFPAIITCEKIACQYSQVGKVKLAAKFLDQALTLSERLGNKRLINSFRERIGLTFSDRERLENRLDIIHQISDILKNIGNYSFALDSIVKFAVDETGAERGALLLYSKDSGELRVKSFIDCDQESIKDITALSRSIPLKAAKDPSPLIIKDAQKDSRTKKSQSVFIHNIRSVICIPIRSEDTVHGVLYLDHHTIPALFDNSDLVFASSLGNFMATMLAAVQRYRTVSVSSSQLSRDLSQLGIGQTIITNNKSTIDILEKIPEIARTNASVLILGESGTGKEIICQMIHQLSHRADKPLVKMNCAAIASTLIESELFGISKGVATGVEEREGKFEAADMGILFLDEIADMPLEIQAKILRVLEYQQFERVGSNRTVSTDIRFIFATNKDIAKLIKSGKFREDLYYRINTITIEIPPLRERTEDILLLLDHFIKVFAPDESAAPRFSQEAINGLLSYSWPGNVRELKNLVEKYCILHQGKLIRIIDLPNSMISNIRNNVIGEKKAEAIERARIKGLLSSHAWNQSRVAKIIGMPLSTFRRRLKNLGIKR